MPWLHSAHRILVRLACVLAARMETDDFGVQASQALGSLLSKLGATPVDASRLNFETEEEPDPADKFFGRH